MKNWPYDFIFLSTHSSVTDELYERKIDYMCVYPEMDAKNIYINRYKNRGDSDEFVDNIDYHWDMYIVSCQCSQAKIKIELSDDIYLLDVFETMMV